MSDAHETVAERFAEADLAADRFIEVQDGEKRSYDHDTRYSSPLDVPGTNYGIYTDGDDELLILDIDDHEGGAADQSSIVGRAALEALPDTLEIESPHVRADSATSGHWIFAVTGDRPIAEIFDDGLGTKNPVPSWGEVLAKNKYAVGAGSQLDGCDKDWCEDCATADGGRYTIKTDRPIATVDAETLVEALAADPDLTRVEDAGQNQTLDRTPTDGSDGRQSDSSDEEYPDLTREEVEGLLEQIPGTQQFDEWIKTAYAVYSWDDAETGKEVFEEWSKTNAKWEPEEDHRQIDHIWSSGDSNGDAEGNAGVGTLIHIADQHGDASEVLASGRVDAASAKTPAELIAEHSEKYDDPDEVPDDLADLAGDASEDRDSDSDSEADVENIDQARDWADVRTLYDLAEEEDHVRKSQARLAAAEVLEDETSWMYVIESERLWVYDQDSGTFQSDGEGEIAKTLEREIKSYKTKREKNEIIDRVADRNQVRRTQLNARDSDDPYLCVGNGVVNLRTGQLHDHSPEYRFTRGLRWNYAEDDETADRETILSFLDEVTERPEDRDTLLDHLAHGLMPGHPYRAFVVAFGPGGNGKTQVAELFRGFVNRENAAAVEIDELTNDDYSTSDLPGCFINWGDDMAGDGGGTLKDLSLLKKATGGSEIRCNEKFEKTFNFKNEAAMFFSANEPPRIGEKKRSIQDRIYPIRMPYRFVSDPDASNPLEKEKVPNKAEALLEDEAAMRGLLALAIEHAQEIIENRGEYSQPESPEERLEKYNREADPIVRFAQTALVESDGDALIRKDDAYRVYHAMVESWEERAAGERGFKRQLPRAANADIDTAESRALATDSDPERVKCYKRVEWTEAARDHMPDWMEARYSEHFGDETLPAGSETETDDDLALGARDPQYGAGFTAEVQTVNDGEYSREAQGRLAGEHGTYIGLVVPGGNDIKLSAFEGERVRLDDVTLRTDDDGLLEAVIDDAVEIERVADDSPRADTDDDSGATATADGGQPAQEGDQPNVLPLIVKLVQESDSDRGMAHGDLVDALAQEGVGTDRAEHRIEKAKQEGDIYEPASGHYRTT